jgi:predicted Zn-dependent peptidase
MNTEVNMFNTVVSGKVSDRNAQLLMKALLAYANQRRSDSDAIEYYVKSKHLQSSRTIGVLDDETMQKAERLFDNLTSKMNDGVLVIVGDMDQTDLKKQLQAYVGQFKVRSVATRRPSQGDPQTAGISTYYKEAQEESIMMTISARMPMTAENHMAIELSMMLLERKLKEEFSAGNLDVTLSYDRDIYPDERFRVVVKLSGASSEGTLQQMRECMMAYATEHIDGNLLKACREYLKHEYALKMEQPQYWLKVIPLRHLEGKDFTTGYAAKIDSVTPDGIKAVFQALEKGAGAEVITRNK